MNVKHQNPSGSHDRQLSTRSLGWRVATVLIVVVSVSTLGAVVLAGLSSPKKAGPNLTHTIRRGEFIVSVTEPGTLESSENTEIICKVRGSNTVIWVVESGTEVQPGDELLRLDTLFIEEQINERTKYALWSRSAAERSKADVARSELAISEYLEGRYVAQLANLEKDLAIAESNLRTAQNMLEHAKLMADRDYVSDLEVEAKDFAVKQSGLAVDLKKTEIDVLKRFTRAEQLETLKGNLAANKARHEADKERAYADAMRRDRALEELGHCVIQADRSGLVIYPSAAAWKNAPDITEGATVHKDQVLLLMPDLSKMQVKIGIHESVIDRIGTGMKALVKVADGIIEGEVASVAPVTSPAGWWTGNVVKYETIISLPEMEGLKPGMSAEVEVILASYEDVLMAPVSSVLETETGTFCWVASEDGPQRRRVQLGDTNDIFIEVVAGLKEGEQLVLNPMAVLDEAQGQVLQQQALTSQNEKGGESASETEASSSGAAMGTPSQS